MNISPSDLARLVRGLTASRMALAARKVAGQEQVGDATESAACRDLTRRLEAEAVRRSRILGGIDKVETERAIEGLCNFGPGGDYRRPYTPGKAVDRVA